MNGSRAQRLFCVQVKAQSYRPSLTVTVYSVLDETISPKLSFSKIGFMFVPEGGSLSECLGK